MLLVPLPPCKKACYYNDGIAGGSDFSDDIFEDCHCTDGQGVYKTPGEAPTGKRFGPSSGSRLTTTTTTVKPEETPRQVEKGTMNY